MRKMIAMAIAICLPGTTMAQDQGPGEMMGYAMFVEAMSELCEGVQPDIGYVESIEDEVFSSVAASNGEERATELLGSQQFEALAMDSMRGYYSSMMDEYGTEQGICEAARAGDIQGFTTISIERQEMMDQD